MGIARELPNNTEAERGVLGTFLNSHELFLEYHSSLTPLYFYGPAHRTILEAMLQVDQGGQSVGLQTVAAILHDQGKLVQVGGAVALSELSDIIPRRQDLKAWIDIVIDKALRRNLIELMNKATIAAHQGQDSAEDIAERLLRDMRQGMQHRTKAVSIAQAMPDTMAEIEDRVEGKKDPGLMSGFHGLNVITCGFHQGDLIIIAARPSMGKTSLANNLALDVAKCGFKVMFFSLEMPTPQLIERLLSGESEIPFAAIRTGNLDHRQRQILSDKSEKIAQLPIKFDDQAGLSIAQLQARAKVESLKGGIDMVIVDYLQLLNAPGAQNREREVSLISSGLKQLAKDLNIPVVALSQLNRESEKRTGKTPKLSDLRDSGSIEQDADLILFVNRDKDAKDGPMAGKAELIIAKHRNGPTGSVYLKFEGHFCRFLNA